MAKKAPKVEVKLKTSKIQKIDMPKIAHRKLRGDGLSEGFDIKVNINGHERWVTKGVIETAIQRGQDVTLPKGSPFVIPGHLKEFENCKGCGKR